MRRLNIRRASPSTRRWNPVAVVLLALVTVVVVPLIAVRSSAHATRSGAAVRESTTATSGRASTNPSTSTASTTTTTVFGRGVALDPSWPKTVTLLTDSVTLGAVDALRAALPGWQLEVLGKPALMVKQAVPQYLPPGKRVGSVVVIGLAYNSLWERDRKNFGDWAGQFDREANRLIADVRARGAKKIVWVTLREPSLSVVNANGHYQYEHYAWFFPYVNERLRALVKRQPDIALADWAAVSNRSGVTYDLIHLDPLGARLMAREIVKAIGA